MAVFDERGRQVPDPRPVEVPLSFQRPPSLQEEIKRFVRLELSKRAASQELESFDEADDFDVDDEDPLPVSAYEVREMVPEPGDDDADPPKADVKHGHQTDQAVAQGEAAAQAPTASGAPGAPAGASPSKS